MSANSSQLYYIMQRLHEKEKVLEFGKKDDKGRPKIEDRFKEINNAVQEGIYYIIKKQEERDEKVKKTGPSAETVNMNGEIKNKITEVQKQIGQMNDELRKQQKDKKRYSNTELEVKENMHNNCMERLRAIQNIEKGRTSQTHEKLKTITELQSELLGGSVSAEQKEKQRQADKGLTVDKKAALDQFEKKNEEQDSFIIKIIGGLQDLNKKAVLMGEQLSQQERLIKNLDKEADKTNNQLVNANTKLKNILIQYREPSKFCMDIVLVCILLGLGGVIYNMLSA